MCTGCLTFYTGVDQDPLEMYGKTNQKDYSCIASGPSTSSDPVWVPPDSIKYREIKGVCGAAQWARKLKKVQAKKFVKSSKSEICFRENAFLAALNFFPVQKLIFGHF